jgi:hypothetical protein
MVDETVGTMAKIATSAAATMWVLLGAEHPPQIRLGAARGILSSLIALESHASLARRLTALEGKVLPGADHDEDVDIDDDDTDEEELTDDV